MIFLLVVMLGNWHISKWNPPGIYGGVPISIAVDSENPDIVYKTAISAVFLNQKMQ